MESVDDLEFMEVNERVAFINGDEVNAGRIVEVMPNGDHWVRFDDGLFCAVSRKDLKFLR